VRTKLRKSDTHGQTNPKHMEEAVKVVLNGRAIRKVAIEKGISKSTLQRYVATAKANGERTDGLRFKPNYEHGRIFSDDEEIELCCYVKTAAKHHRGLCPSETRKLAYQYAAKNEKSSRFLEK